MKIRFGIQYDDMNDEQFDVSQDYYNEDNSYIDTLNKLRDTDKVNGHPVSTPIKVDNHIEVSDYRNVAYCDAIMFGEDGKENDVDGFISDYVDKERHLYAFRFNIDESDDDFYDELKNWAVDREMLHKYLNGTEASFKENIILDKEPTRDIFVEFYNKSNEKKTAILTNCVIMEIQNVNTYVLMTEKIMLVENNSKQ